MFIDIRLLLSGFLIMVYGAHAYAQTSSLVYYDQNKRLIYQIDAKGNSIPDFSYVGYKNGEAPIPVFPVVKTVTPVAGDNLQNIQSAINEVAGRSPDENGVRGAILLKAGVYPVNGKLSIATGGIALIGEGSDERGTVIIARLKEQHDFIHFKGPGSASADGASLKRIIDPYIPIGGNSFTVESGHTFQPGDEVYFERRPNQKWIELLGMHLLSQTDPEDTDWTPDSYIIRHKRKIAAVKSDTIVIDAPVVDVVDTAYAAAYLRKYTWNGRISNVGLENIRLVSEYASLDDENHGWNAVKLDNVENGWVRNIEAWHFGYSAVNVGGGSSLISVLDSKCMDPMSQTTGGRKYSFNIDGQRVLVKNCFTRGGRHDYVNGSRVAGPNVFVNCRALNQKADIGPHHRWATGILFDNIEGDRDMNVQNRLNSGSGHGWAGAQTMFWNCTAKTMIVQDPPGDHRNWAIGNKASITGKSFPIGAVESTDVHVTPASLYEAQLAERLGLPAAPPPAPDNLKAEAIYDTQVKLSWIDHSAGESGFLIEVSADNGQSWNQAALVSQDVVSCTISGLTENTQYQFRVAAQNAFGQSAFSDTVVANTLENVTSVPGYESGIRLQAVPNPFSGFVTIRFTVKAAGKAELTLMDGYGRHTHTLFSGFKNPGSYELSWLPPQGMPSGCYFLKFVSGDGSSLFRLVRIK